LYTIKDLQVKSAECRKTLTTMIYEAKTGHIGGSLSSIDIIVALYFGVMNIDPQKPKMENRDRFIMSKGHSVEAYYTVLASMGFFSAQELSTFSKFGSRLIGHPSMKVQGVEMNTGALGHGLPVAVGMALAGKMDHKDYKVYTLMGDGEQAEGSVWEAAMAAANYGLDHLVGIVDRNRLQISGGTENVMKLESLADKWRSFGWEVIEVDGHDMTQLMDTFKSIPVVKGKPHMVIANTTKGKGISYMENKAQWHHGVLDEEQYRIAMKELNLRFKEVSAL
jgi:transketolase